MKVLPVHDFPDFLWFLIKKSQFEEKLIGFLFLVTKSFLSSIACSLETGELGETNN